MASRRFPLVRLGLTLLAGPAAGGAEPGWRIPPIDGELAGEFSPLLLPGAPPLAWKVTVVTERPHARTVGLTVTGPGLNLRGGAVLDARGEGTWKIDVLEVDLGEWVGWLAPRFAPGASGLAIAGELSVRGEGTWRGGVLGGRADLTWRDGRFEDPVRKLVIEGISAALAFEDLAGRRTGVAQVVQWESGRYDTVPLGAGRVVYALEGEKVRINSASLQVLGGVLQAAEVIFSTSSPNFAVTARLTGVDLSKLLFLLPPVLAAAQGRLDGSLALRRDAGGLQIGVGNLSLRPGESAELRFAPTPGLLSTQLPAAVRQHYPGLVQLESGGIPLRADLLEVSLTPAGDAEGRTAAVRIEGGPSDPNLRAPVVLQVNVRGPLDSLVKFGTNSKLRFGDAK